jgi:hypothetical protein
MSEPCSCFADGDGALDGALSTALAAASGAPAVPGYARPIKSLLNLTTVVDSLSFSPDEQVSRKQPFDGSDTGVGAHVCPLIDVCPKTSSTQRTEEATADQQRHSAAGNGSVIAMER